MTVDICADNLEIKRKTMNSNSATKISVTHILIKVVSETLREFPNLYAYFNGKKFTRNAIVKINLPVAENNHVEYVVIENAEDKKLSDISIEVKDEITNIRNNCGKFYMSIKRLYSLPSIIRFFVLKNISLSSTDKNYGNFPLTNFGSFGVKNGTPALSSPIVAALCIGLIETNEVNGKQIMPITLVFDHRPIDGAYAGRFLTKIKKKLESNEVFD